MPDKSNYLRTSGTFTPDIIEDIQVKAELGQIPYPRIWDVARATMGNL